MYYKEARKVYDVTSPKLLLRKQMAVSVNDPEKEDDDDDTEKKPKKEMDTDGIKDDRDFRPSQKEIEDNMSIKEKAIKAIFG